MTGISKKTMLLVSAFALIAVTLVFFASPPLSFAADGDPPQAAAPAPAAATPVRDTPSVGTLVAAALETVGYVSQARVLRDLANLLERLGALIYVCCIFTAILSVTVSGRYELGLWLLMGPPLFFFLIKPSVSSAGAEWQFGAFRDQKAQRASLLQGSGVTLSENDKVSWFFHGFNVLVSDTVQQLVKLITDDSVKRQMLFMTRQQVMDDLFSTEIDKPDLEGLAAITSAHCWRELNAARIIGASRREPGVITTPEYNRAVEEYCSDYVEGKNRVYLAPGPARSYVVDLLKLDENNENTEKLFNNLKCSQLWEWLERGVQKRAREALAHAENARINPQAPQSIFDKIVKDIDEKLQSPNEIGQTAAAAPVPCPGGTGITAPAPNDARSRIHMMLAAMMLRKVLSNDPRGHMISQFAEHSGIQLQPLDYRNHMSREASYEVVRRFNLDRNAEATRFEAFTIAMTLPYIQGVGLYLLATLFPFFALMVIIPGQASSFFMWCALWIWLKSWDVGWALVMVADELMWSVMPHSSFFRVDGTANEPTSVFEAAFDGDYGYSLATYYMLLSAMITAVPIISANAVLGTKKQIAGFFVDGFKSMASAMSAHVSDQMIPEQLQYFDRRREYALTQRSASLMVDQQLDMLISRDMYSGGADLRRTFLSGQSKAAEVDAKLQEFATTVASMVKQNFAGLQGDEFKAAAIKEQAQNKLAEIKRQYEQNQHHIDLIESKEPHNKFTDLMHADVIDRDSKGNVVGHHELGMVGALIEVARQSDINIRENVTVIKRNLGVKDGSFEEKMLTAGAMPEFADDRFRDPRLRNYDLKGRLPRELNELRGEIEHLESMSDYYKGIAETMGWGTAAGGSIASFAGPGGMLLTLRAARETDAIYQSGLSHARLASAMRADYIERVGKWGYFAAGNDEQFIRNDSIRGGISNRGEWFTSPDAPVDVLAGAEMRALQAEQSANLITGRALGNVFMNFLVK